MSARLRERDDVVDAGDDGGCCPSGWMAAVVVVVVVVVAVVVAVVVQMRGELSTALCWADLVEEGGLKQGSGSSGSRVVKDGQGWSRMVKVSGCPGWSGYLGIKEGAPCAHTSCQSATATATAGPQGLDLRPPRRAPGAGIERRAHAGSQSQLTPRVLPTLQRGAG